MTLMSVNNPKEQGQGLSVAAALVGGKQTDAVLRLPRGESLEDTPANSRSRRIGWPPGGTTSWLLASRAEGPAGVIRRRMIGR
jgi:hypothetical protein